MFEKPKNIFEAKDKHFEAPSKRGDRVECNINGRKVNGIIINDDVSGGAMVSILLDEKIGSNYLNGYGVTLGIDNLRDSEKIKKIGEVSDEELKNIKHKLEEELSYALGVNLHDTWREKRRNEDGTIEPRWKVYGVNQGGEGKWFNDDVPEGYIENPNNDPDLERQDIANTKFRDLRTFWKADNKDAAEVVSKVIMDTLLKGSSLDELLVGENLENGAEYIHNEFLKRRKERNAWIPDSQNMPYNDLEDDEKEKDREQLRDGVAFYKSM